MKGYKLLLALIFVSLLLAGSSSSPSVAQRIEQMQQPIDYAQRERRAPPEIKQRLGRLREQIKANKLTFEVGYTTALDESLEKLAGTRAPADLPEQAKRQNEIGARLLHLDL